MRTQHYVELLVYVVHFRHQSLTLSSRGEGRTKSCAQKSFATHPGPLKQVFVSSLPQQLSNHRSGTLPPSHGIVLPGRCLATSVTCREGTVFSTRRDQTVEASLSAQRSSFRHGRGRQLLLSCSGKTSFLRRHLSSVARV